MFPPPRISVEGTEFIVGVNMLKFLNPYISLIEQYRLHGYSVYTEMRVKLSISGGLVWGTADCVAVKRGAVSIVDLKYGMGVPVAPDSAQLKIYALGALEDFNVSTGMVDMTIVQPRLDMVPRTVTMPVRKLIEWSKAELEPAIDRLVDGDVTEKVGSWCRWCVRRNECHAYAHQRSGQAADVFNDVPLDGDVSAP